MSSFCHFHTLINHKKPYNAVMLAKGISVATQRPKKLDFKNLVHDFSEGVRISVHGLNKLKINVHIQWCSIEMRRQSSATDGFAVLTTF